MREVLAFLRERLHFYLKDVRGFAYDVVNAVLAADADDVRDAMARAEALTAARASADFEAVSAAFKRINNILRQAAEKGFAVGSPDGVTLVGRGREACTMRRRRWLPRLRSCASERAYGEALAKIATLRPVVDAFFDKVMVLDPDAAVRGAHLGLIDGVLRGFSGIADFSEIVTGLAASAACSSFPTHDAMKLRHGWGTPFVANRGVLPISETRGMIFVGYCRTITNPSGSSVRECARCCGSCARAFASVDPVDTAARRAACCRLTFRAAVL